MAVRIVNSRDRGSATQYGSSPRPGHRRLAGHRLFRHWSDINWRSFLLVMTGYYAGGIVGILLGFPPSGIAAIWPSTAILLAGLLLAPPRYWWLYLLGAVPTHLLVVANFQVPEVPVVVMLCQVGINVLHALIAALALRFVIGPPSARQPPQHGCIHPSCGRRGDCRRLRGGSLAFSAHWLGHGLLARVASASPRERIRNHRYPSSDTSGVRRPIGWAAARTSAVLCGACSHHGANAATRCYAPPIRMPAASTRLPPRTT